MIKITFHSQFALQKSSTIVTVKRSIKMVIMPSGTINLHCFLTLNSSNAIFILNLLISRSMEKYENVLFYWLSKIF